MAIKQIGILDATAAQRETFAANFLGIDVAGKSEDDILSTILAANGGSELMFFDDAVSEPSVQDVAAALGHSAAPPAQDANGRSMQGGTGHGDPQVTLTIPNENRNGTTYKTDVEVGVNGRVWQIKRAVQATIPYRVYLALLNATQTNFEHVDSGYGNVIEQASDAPRIQMQVHRLPSDEEIAAWHAKYDSIEMA